MSKLKYLKLVEKFAVEASNQLFGETLWSENLSDNDKKMEILASLNRHPKPEQAELSILPASTSLEHNKVVALWQEPGTGKTQCSFSTARLAVERSKNKKICMLTDGSKHLHNMKKEAEAIFGDEAEVKILVNKHRYEKVAKGEVTPYDVVNTPCDGKIRVYLLSKDIAKMSLKEESVYNWGDKCPCCGEKILSQSMKANNRKKRTRMPAPPSNCPSCDVSFVSKVAKNLCVSSTEKISLKLKETSKMCFLDEEGFPVYEEVIEHGLFPQRIQKQFKSGIRKTSVGEKLLRELKNVRKRPNKETKNLDTKHAFNTMIFDEVQNMQSGDSLQGQVYRKLVSASNNKIIMTGTLSNGYASSIFYILQGAMPKYFKERGYRYKDLPKFIDHYGARKTEVAIVESKGSKKSTKVSELPKISDGIVSLLSPFSVWVKMEDLNLDMPSYSESSEIIPMDNELIMKLNDYKTKVILALRQYNPLLIKSFAGKFMYMQNNPTHKFEFNFTGEVTNKIQNPMSDNPDDTIEITEKKEFSFPFEPFDSLSKGGPVFSKEKALVRDVIAHKKRGRKILIYSIYNKAAGISNRLQEVLENQIEGIRVRTMPENIGGTKILPWIDENSGDDVDVVICSPKKVATGYNLVQFSSFFFYESGVNLREAQQAARRGWRAFGQTQEVEVKFYAYEGVQASILEIMAKKMRAAAVVEGRKVSAGQIAEEFDNEKDITEALNSIADNIERSYEADFSTQNIAGGKRQELSEFSKRYDEILKRIKAFKEENTLAEEFETIETEEDAIEEIAETEEEIVEEINSCNNTSFEEECLVAKDYNEEHEEDQVEIKISAQGQLFFDF